MCNLEDCGQVLGIGGPTSDRKQENNSESPWHFNDSFAAKAVIGINQYYIFLDHENVNLYMPLSSISHEHLTSLTILKVSISNNFE